MAKMGVDNSGLYMFGIGISETKCLPGVIDDIFTWQQKSCIRICKKVTGKQISGKKTRK